MMFLQMNTRASTWTLQIKTTATHRTLNGRPQFTFVFSVTFSSRGRTLTAWEVAAKVPQRVVADSRSRRPTTDNQELPVSLCLSRCLSHITCSFSPSLSLSLFPSLPPSSRSCSRVPSLLSSCLSIYGLLYLCFQVCVFTMALDCYD